MILLAILGLVVPLFFGYCISLLLKTDEIHERILLSGGLGFGTIAYLMFVLNGFFNLKLGFGLASVLLALMLVSSFAMLAAHIIRIRKSKKAEAGRASRINGKKPGSPFRENKLIKAIICVLILTIIYKALFFPIINGDGVGFHAPIIKDIYDSGMLPDDVGPSTVEFTRAYPPLFYMFGAWLNILNQQFSDVLLQSIPLLFGIFILIAVYSLGMAVFDDRRKALLGVLLMLSLPMFVNHAVYLNNDTIFAFFAVTGAYFMLKYIQSRKTAHAILGFIILGFSINTKQQGIMFLMSVFISLLVILFSNRIILLFKGKDGIKSIMKSKEVKAIMIGLISLVIIISPFFIRNYIEFNDPIYPYMTALYLHLPGKNFVPFLFEPVHQAYDRANLFYSPSYALFSIVNYVRDIDYSMSVFLAVLVFLALISFKEMRSEQRYLLYFIILFTAYYAISFLLKYRYFMAGAALICVVAAGKLDDLIGFRSPAGSGSGSTNKKDRRIMILSAILLIIALAAYAFAMIKKDFIIGLLGFRAEHFLVGVEPLIIIHLCVALAAITAVLLLKNHKARSAVVILLLIIPSAYSLAIINYGLTKTGLGVFDSSKDSALISRELKFIPDRDAVLKMNFGKKYDAMLFLIENTPPGAKILDYGGLVYYAEEDRRELIPIDSYKMADAYNSDLPTALGILEELDISYIIYIKPGWEEAVFGRGALLARCEITKGIDNPDHFRKLYDDNETAIYAVIRPEKAVQG